MRSRPVRNAVLLLLGLTCSGCTRRLGIEVSGSGLLPVFAFHDHGLLWQRREIARSATLYEVGSAPRRELCFGPLGTEEWKYGSLIPGCPVLESGHTYEVYANGSGRSGSRRFIVFAHEPVTALPDEF